MSASSLGASAQRLEAARRNADSDPAGLAEALLQHANELVLLARLAEARDCVEEAADLHRTRGRSFDEARCFILAASLSRLAGQYSDANAEARRALSLVEAQGPLAVSAWGELGEVAMVEGLASDAADAWTAALDAGTAAGHAATFRPARAALLRKRAVARTNLAQYDQALEDLHAAHALLMELGDTKGATRVLIEQATALHYAGRGDECAEQIRQVIAFAERAADFAALADIWMLVAAQAFERNDAAAALNAARAARDAALQAVVPQAYFAAAVALSRAADALGDRVEAYSALATAWVTLGDAIGKEAAQAWVEPVLGALRTEWGEQVFADIRSRHDARRRAALGKQD